MKTEKKKKAKKTKAGNLWKRNGTYYLVKVEKGNRTVVSLHTGKLTEAEKCRDDILKPALMANTSEKVARNIAEARELLTDVKYTLDVVWNQYLKSSKRPQSSPGTLGNYERCWRLFKLWLTSNHKEIERINQITEKEAEAYAAHLWEKDEKKDTGKKEDEKKELTAEEKKLKRGITANTFNYHIQALNLIFKIIINNEKTPFSEIQRKKEEKINRKNFTDEQIKKIFAAFEDEKLIIPNKSEIKLLCYIGALTGLRMADAVLLKWEQIDFANRMITATPIKTRGIQRKVHIPLAPQLKSQLDRAESLDKSEYVMPGIVERYQRNPDGVVDDFHKILDLESVGLKEVKEAARGKNRRLYSYHSFRHSFASFAANAGIPISTLAAILGDNTRTLEKYYVKISDESKTKAIMSMPQLTAGTDTGAVIEVKPISELDEIKNRVKQALEIIGTAKLEDISETFKKKLLSVLAD